ncbi:DinB family protein [Actinomycetes bacterium KLBMP 9797]
MNVSEVLTEAFDRLPELVRSAVKGLSAEQLRWAPAPDANPVGWLVWHLTRVEDSHIAEILESDQVWVADGWAGRFGLEPDPANTGYGHAAAQVAAVRPESAAALVEYHGAVAARTRALLRGLTDRDFDRIVDENWDPPVTLGVRLISVVNDETQHVGQAAYVRGLIP